ncbi:hypothetical protein AHF37_02624 [Paragonimus kellicotti]|nr:hypothetical protein AHF37_02624 [Paragonimus kellicotti]
MPSLHLDQFRFLMLAAIILPTDVVGPLPPSKYLRHLLTCVNKFTQWPAVFSICDITTQTLATTITVGRISCLGMPSAITADRGNQLESYFSEQITSLFGIQRIRTKAHHLQSNRMVRRGHRTAKATPATKLD